MRISYAIPVCYEHKELQRLLKLLVACKRPEDEIVVQADLGNTTKEVYQVIDEYKNNIKLVEFPLKGDFGSFKNNLKKNKMRQSYSERYQDSCQHFIQIKPMSTIVLTKVAHLLW